MPNYNPTNYTAVTAAYDAEFAQDSVKAIDVLAEGDLFVEDIEGNTLHYTFDVSTLNTPLPYRLELRIRKIIGDGAGSVGDGSTGTDIALADLIVLH